MKQLLLTIAIALGITTGTPAQTIWFVTGVSDISGDEEGRRFLSLPERGGLYIGEKPDYFQGTRLEEWNDSAFYYILYPREVDSPSLAKKYGAVLATHRKVIVIRAGKPIDSTCPLSAFYDPIYHIIKPNPPNVHDMQESIPQKSEPQPEAHLDSLRKLIQPADSIATSNTAKTPDDAVKSDTEPSAERKTRHWYRFLCPWCASY